MSDVDLRQKITECQQTVYARWAKPALDRTAAAALLVLTLPVQAVISIATLIDDGSPVYFRQERVGRNGKTFTLFKFRTMKNGAHARSGGYPGSDEITRMGSFLRRTSLDEVPQLLNILRGEMSFVGPRPTLPSQVERYTEKQTWRHLGAPGITGLAQVLYRNDAPWSVRIEADLKYLSEMNWRSDLALLFRTLGVSSTGSGQTVGQTAEQVDDLGGPHAGDRV